MAVALWNARIESQLGCWLPWLYSAEMVAQFVPNHHCFLPNPYQFVIPLSSYHSALLKCVGPFLETNTFPNVISEISLEVSCNRVSCQSVVRESVKRRLDRWCWRIPIVRSRYQGTTSEDVVVWKDLGCAVVICKVRKLDTVSQLLVIATSKRWINSISNPNSVESHSCTCS
jgi:hypothetical protein